MGAVFPLNQAKTVHCYTQKTNPMKTLLNFSKALMITGLLLNATLSFSGSVASTSGVTGMNKTTPTKYLGVAVEVNTSTYSVYYEADRQDSVELRVVSHEGVLLLKKTAQSVVGETHIVLDGFSAFDPGRYVVYVVTKNEELSRQLVKK